MQKRQKTYSLDQQCQLLFIMEGKASLLSTFTYKDNTVIRVLFRRGSKLHLCIHIRECVSATEVSVNG